MLMKIRLRFRLLFLCFFLNLVLFLVILFRFFPVRLATRTTQAYFRVQDRRFDPFRLIKRPLIRRFDLSHHCLVGVTSGEQSGDRRQDRKNRSAQRDPGNPFLAAMLGVRRQSVSVIAATFRAAGFIRYVHGRVTVLDRQGLEATACDCYPTLRKLYGRVKS